MLRKLIHNYREMTLPVKASIWFVISGLMKDVIDVLATPVFTRILTTEQYGYYNVYNSWYLIVKIVFTLCLYSEVFNVGLVRFEKERNQFISASLGFVTSLVGTWFLVYLLFFEKINRIIGLPWYLIVLMFAHVLMFVPYYFWLRRERFVYHYKNIVIVSLMYVVLQPALAIIAILYCDLSIDPGYARIIAAVGIQIIIGIALYISIMWSGRSYFDKRIWKYSLKTGVELVPFSLSKVVLNQSDRIMINFFWGSGETAIYSVSHSAAFVLQAVTEALNGAFVPWFYRRLRVNTYDGIKNVINGLILLVAVCVAGIDVTAPEIMRILGNEAYYRGIYCIPALAYSISPQQLLTLPIY